MAIIQVRVDDDLKEEVMSIYEKLGIDLSSAIRMFLKRCVMMKGIPFPMILGKKTVSDEEALKILKECQQISEENGNSELTLEEINEIIRLTREERKKKK